MTPPIIDAIICAIISRAYVHLGILINPMSLTVTKSYERYATATTSAKRNADSLVGDEFLIRESSCMR